MRASQEFRWKQSIKDNDERRRRYEESSRRLEEQERCKAQEALDRRRQERARMDELMRRPSQQPAPPKKPILRKGAGLSHKVAIQPKVEGAVASPTAAAAAAVTELSQPDLETQRKEWRDGLKNYIARQREAAKGSESSKGVDQSEALSWQELKLAAEAGFEELLKHQEAAAITEPPQQSWRRPGMSRAKGGTPYVNPAATQQIAAADRAQTAEPVQLAPWTQSPAGQAPVTTNCTPTSKWAVRLKQTAEGPIAPVSVPASASVLAAEQQSEPVQAATAVGHDNLCQAGKNQAASSSHSGAACELGSSLAVPVPTSSPHMQRWPCVDGQLEMDSKQDDLAAVDHQQQLDPQQHGSIIVCPGQGHECEQLLPAAAQQAASAMRESMEQLHRATGVNCTSHAWCKAAQPAGDSSLSSSMTLHSGLQQEYAGSGACAAHNMLAAQGSAQGSATNKGMEECLSSAVAGGSCMMATHDTPQPSLAFTAPEQQLQEHSPHSPGESQPLAEHLHAGSSFKPADAAHACSKASQEQHEVLPSVSGTEPGLSRQASAKNGNVLEGCQQGGPTLDSLLAEVEQLTALRHALKAEFEAMGNERLAAAMGTLSCVGTDQQHVHLSVESNQEPQGPHKHHETWQQQQLAEGQGPATIQHHPQQQQEQQQHQAEHSADCSVCHLPSQSPLQKLLHHLEHTAAPPATGLQLQSHWQHQEPGQAARSDPCCLLQQHKANSMSAGVVQKQVEIDHTRLSQSAATSQARVPTQQGSAVPCNGQPGAVQATADNSAEWHKQQQQQLPQQPSDICSANHCNDIDAAVVEHGGAGEAGSDEYNEGALLSSLRDGLVQHVTAASAAAQADVAACNVSLTEGESEQMSHPLPPQPATEDNLSFSFSFGVAPVLPDSSQPAVTHMLGGPCGVTALRVSVNNPLFQVDDADGTTGWQLQQEADQQPVQQQGAAVRLRSQQEGQQQRQTLDGGLSIQAAPHAPAEMHPQLGCTVATQQLSRPLRSTGGQLTRHGMLLNKSPAAQSNASTDLVEGFQEKASATLDLASVGAGLQWPLAGDALVPDAAQPALLDSCLPRIMEGQDHCNSWKQCQPALAVPAAALQPTDQRPQVVTTYMFQHLGLPVDEGAAVESLSNSPNSTTYVPDCSEPAGDAEVTAGDGRLSTASNPTGQKCEVVCGLQAAERPLVNQGSYLVAALQSKLRLEREHAEQQGLQAAAAAAKHAAAAKLAAEKQAAQNAAAEKATRQKVPVAVGSYAHVGSCSAAALPVMQAYSVCGASTSQGSSTLAEVKQEKPQQQQPPQQQKQLKKQQQVAQQVEHTGLLGGSQGPARAQDMVLQLVPPSHAHVRHAAGTTPASTTNHGGVRSPLTGESCLATQAAPGHQGARQPDRIRRQLSVPAAGAEQLSRAVSTHLALSTPGSRIPSAPGTPGGGRLAGAAPVLNTASTDGSSWLDPQDDSCEFLERPSDQEDNAVLEQQSPAASGLPAVSQAHSRFQKRDALAGVSQLSGQPSSQEGMWAAVQAAATAAVKKQAAAILAPVRPSAGSATSTAPSAPSPLSAPAAAAAAADGDMVTSPALFAQAGTAAARGVLLTGSSNKPSSAVANIKVAKLCSAGSASTLPSKGQSKLPHPAVNACQAAGKPAAIKKHRLQPARAAAAGANPAASSADINKSTTQGTVSLSQEEADLLASLQQLDARMKQKSSQQQRGQQQQDDFGQQQQQQQDIDLQVEATAAKKRRDVSHTQLGIAAKPLKAVKQGRIGPGITDKLADVSSQHQAHLEAQFVTATSTSKTSGKPSRPAAALPPVALAALKGEGAGIGSNSSSTAGGRQMAGGKRIMALPKQAAWRGSDAATEAYEPQPASPGVGIMTGERLIAAALPEGAAAAWWRQQWQLGAAGPWSQVIAPQASPGSSPWMPPVAMMAWGAPDIQQQWPQQLLPPPNSVGPHAAAALAAATPMHLQARLLQHASPTAGPSNFITGQPGNNYSQACALQQTTQGMWQQEHQLVWAALQAQQQQQQQWQQHTSAVLPATASTGGVYSSFKQLSGRGMSLQPHSAPSGSQHCRGTPLLPTLHYQQTVMHDRTSSGGDEGHSNGGLGTASVQGNDSSRHFSAGQSSRVAGGSALPNVWPVRGVERTAANQGNCAGGGAIRVYKADLLL